jgi:hypothetical protein
MLPINVTIGRSDLWDNPCFIYPGASLSLPATRAEIDDALDRARVKDGESYKVMECIDGNGHEMDYLPVNPPLDMLNFLAHKLADFEDYEINQFVGLVKMEKELPAMLRLINITENMQDCICIPAKNDAELGEFYIDNEMVEKFISLPEEVYNCLDYTKIGKAQAKAEGGIFFEVDGYRYYAVNHAGAGEFREVFSEDNPPKLPEEASGYVFKVSFFNRGSGQGAWMTLPCPVRSITDKLDEINVSDITRLGFSEIKCTLPSMPENIYRSADIYEINSLAFKINELLRNGECPKYKAMLEAYEIDSVGDAIDLADNIDAYEYYPEASYPADYGREFFFRSYGINPDDPALEHLNFANYGFALVKEHDAVQTDYGFIRKAGDIRQAQDEDATQGIKRQVADDPILTPEMKRLMEGVARDLTSLAVDSAAAKENGGKIDIDRLRTAFKEIVAITGIDEHHIDQFDMEVGEAEEAAPQQGGLTQSY